MNKTIETPTKKDIAMQFLDYSEMHEWITSP